MGDEDFREAKILVVSDCDIRSALDVEHFAFRTKMFPHFCLAVGPFSQPSAGDGGLESREGRAARLGDVSFLLGHLENIVCRVAYVAGPADPRAMYCAGERQPTLTPSSVNIHRRVLPLAPELAVAGFTEGGGVPHDWSAGDGGDGGASGAASAAAAAPEDPGPDEDDEPPPLPPPGASPPFPTGFESALSFVASAVSGVATAAPGLLATLRVAGSRFAPAAPASGPPRRTPEAALGGAAPYLDQLLEAGAGAAGPGRGQVVLASAFAGEDVRPGGAWTDRCEGILRALHRDRVLLHVIGAPAAAGAGDDATEGGGAPAAACVVASAPFEGKAAELGGRMCVREVGGAVALWPGSLRRGEFAVVTLARGADGSAQQPWSVKEVALRRIQRTG